MKSEVRSPKSEALMSEGLISEGSLSEASPTTKVRIVAASLVVQACSLQVCRRPFRLPGWLRMTAVDRESRKPPGAVVQASQRLAGISASCKLAPLPQFGFRIPGFAAALAALLALAATALGQPTPRAGYVYPAGGRAGSTFQVVVGGQFLDGATSAFISGTGAQASVVGFNKPMNQGKFNQLRDGMRVLQDRKQAALRDNRRGVKNSTNVWTAADEKKLADMRGQVLKNPPNRQATPAIAETVTLRVTLATNAEPGAREIRLGTPTGLSNPLVFCVGDLPELTAPPARAANPDLDRFLTRLGRTVTNPPTRSEMRIPLPATVNGQIMPGTVDNFRFAARKGQRLVVAASARALIPYLADGVPGWFQATLALRDAKGKELAYTDDFRFNPDPVLFYEIPRNGDYIVEIKDSIYRGREDFVYRLTVGELPFVTSIFPLGGPAGQQTEVELSGWNLPSTKLTVDNEDQPPGVRLISVRKGDWISNPLPFAVDVLPECLEQEGNNEPKHAQRLTMPIIVNGRMDQAGDADLFRFDGGAGDEIVAEVSARRLNSPLDSRLRLTDASGLQIAANDDFDDKGAGLTTHQADSYLRARLPADGTYYLELTDAPHQGGPEYGYRLRVSDPQPDFALRVVPSSLNVRAGASVPITVYALRKDGFTNAITLALQHAPRGFGLSGGRVPAGQDQVKLTLSAPWSASESPTAIHLTGRATIAGLEVVRAAVPAEDMMQAFIYRHLVPANELCVEVTRGFGRGGVKILSAMPLKIPAGGTAVLRIDAPGRVFANQLQLELSDAPEGISLGKVTPAREGTELTLHADAEKAKLGAKGNLIVKAFANRPSAPGKAKAQGKKFAVATLPAIPFEIIQR